MRSMGFGFLECCVVYRENWFRCKNPDYLNFIDSLARISLKREGILIVQCQHSHFTLPPNGNISD
jgi:hypothetical protein